MILVVFFFFKQKTAYEMRISDWSSDVCSSDLLRDRPEPGIVRLTLNRPKAYNSLSTGLMAALQAELDTIRADRSVKAVIIGAAGPGFCAGHEIGRASCRERVCQYV